MAAAAKTAAATKKKRKSTVRRGTGTKIFKVGKRIVGDKPTFVGLGAVALSSQIAKWVPDTIKATKWGAKLVGAPTGLAVVGGGWLVKSDDAFSVGIGMLAATMLNLSFGA